MRSLVVAGLLAAVLATSGCNATKRELVVFFTATATATEHQQARDHCTGAAPHTSPEPLVPVAQTASRDVDVRFRIDRASDHDIAALETCLQRQPGVVGFQDTSDQT
jgi:hypothetical protein